MSSSNLFYRAGFVCLPCLLLACGSESAPSATGGASSIGGSTGVGGASGPHAGAGGTTAASTGTLQAGSLEAYCGAHCDERYRCGQLDVSQEPRAECVGDCVNSWGPVDVYRRDVMAAMQACLQNLACTSSIDDCNIVGANVVSSDPESDPRMVTCMAKASACSGYANPFSDDICLVGLFLVEAKQSAFDACMTQPCQTVLACVNQQLGRG